MKDYSWIFECGDGEFIVVMEKADFYSLDKGKVDVSVEAIISYDMKDHSRCFEKTFFIYEKVISKWRDCPYIDRVNHKDIHSYGEFKKLSLKYSRSILVDHNKIVEVTKYLLEKAFEDIRKYLHDCYLETLPKSIRFLKED